MSFSSISIHTTLAGGDVNFGIFRLALEDFNPHHPRGWRQRIWQHMFHCTRFQSTPPSRVATTDIVLRMDLQNISIHTTLAGGDHISVVLAETIIISIHTTLAGGDGCKQNFRLTPRYFNPHHPRGWRLVNFGIFRLALEDFNPHHPRGWRLCNLDAFPP